MTLRDGTQLEASTGHRTWGAATLFARLLATRSGGFFPSEFGESDHDSGSSTLRVLEVGSGTGLVGMAAARVLEARLPHGPSTRAEVTLSDGGDEPEAVLANLRHNVAVNFSSRIDASDTVRVGVRELDWRDFVGPADVAPSLPRRHRYHIILGSDLAYERGQATLLHAAVAAHLEYPSAVATAVPTFHLMLPLRPTHQIEIDEVEAVFPPAQLSSSRPPALAAADQSDLVRRAGHGTECPVEVKFRLVTAARERFVAPDGFGAGSPNLPRGGAAARGNLAGLQGAAMTYELRRIVWESAVVPA